MSVLYLNNEFKSLQLALSGDLKTDLSSRLIYATDASAYREVPMAVAYPKNTKDIQKLVRFAIDNKTSLIPRTAGTSLAGQVVGNGIVVDVSKYMNQILELNVAEKWVRVEPGVILDNLNLFLKPHGLMFGPETSTSNRCMIGGMIGNNSCGTHSIIYGSTRDHVLEIEAILSDGSEVLFEECDTNKIERKAEENSLQASIYKQALFLNNHPHIKQKIEKHFPDKRVIRRNTGYALDALLQSKPFNFCKLLSGSEGTLAFTTSAKLNLVELPPPHQAVVAVHLHSIAEACRANITALKHSPYAIELMDNIVLELAAENPLQKENSHFIEGKPKAVLISEFVADSKDKLNTKIKAFIEDLKDRKFGYAYPVLYQTDTNKVWELRKAGLGILGNMKGDEKPVPVVEDTAVAIDVLPEYIADFEAMMQKYGKSCVYYAHISAGELHLRPVMNLKLKKEQELFRTIAKESAELVKKYGGSLSGEHGDGRLRGEFIPEFYGDDIYNIFREIKQTWDPNNIFNPNKVIDTPPMNSHLRYLPDQQTKEIKTHFDFSSDLGLLRAVEKCNGTAVCRKTHDVGGTMCPSYMATLDEKDSTRARANLLREFWTNGPSDSVSEHEVKEILDLCLSCKACKSECPSSVDMAKLKAEFLQQYHDKHGIPKRSKRIANTPLLNARFHKMARVVNVCTSLPLVRSVMGFAPQRKFPKLKKLTFSNYLNRSKALSNQQDIAKNGSVYLLVDEFLNYYDVELGVKALSVLTQLGYGVIPINNFISGRTFISKGLVKDTKQLAKDNIKRLCHLENDHPIIGLEPSSLLMLRDEYLDLADKDQKEDAQNIATRSFLFEEYMAQEFREGNISTEAFTTDKKDIIYHGHCQQKTLTSTKTALECLSIPVNYSVQELNTGCCGMAGSFGYEKEHYDLSMKIGELVLFPEVRNAKNKIICASGTSCRHQIKDGTSRTSQHPAEVLYHALVR